MGMRVVRPSLRVGQLGEAQLPDVARECRLGDDESLLRQRLPQLVLTLDPPLADDAEDRGMALDLHDPTGSARYTSRPPRKVAITPSRPDFSAPSAGDDAAAEQSNTTQSP